LLNDATQKAKLIEKNSRYQIETLFSKAEEASLILKKSFTDGDFSEVTVEEKLKKILKEDNSFFGSTLSLKKTPFSPYYYKKDSEILYSNLASNEYNYFEKEWYKIPIEQNKALWSEPYFDDGGGNVLMATYSNPLNIDNEAIAILTLDISLQSIQEMVSTIDILETGYAFMLSKEHKILAHKDESLIMQQYTDSSFEYNKMLKDDDNWIYYVPIVNTNITLVIVFPINELFASLHYLSIIYIVLATVGAILLIITMVIISRRITEPLRELTCITDEIAKGNFNKNITFPKNKDEIYKLSFAIDTMQKAIGNYIEDLKTATINQQKIDSELDIAKAIQMSMLPKKLPQNENIILCAMLKPAKAVGGDFYDFFYINSDHLCFVIADVSGKGVPAAMFMSVTMSYLRAYSCDALSASQLVIKLNNTIASNNDANMFVTLFLGILNVKSGELNYVNAGHDEPYLMSKDKKYKRIKAVGNTVVGAFEGLNYKDETMILEKNSKLFLYTDGVTEAFSKEDELFGDERLSNSLNASITCNTDETILNLQICMNSFTKDCEQSDDITILILEFGTDK